MNRWRSQISNFRFQISVVLLGVLCLFGCGRGDDKQLNLYIWTNYLPEDVVQDFTKETGIRVHIDLYDSNEAVLEKINSGVSDYDLAAPTDYMVAILAKRDLLTPIDHSRLTNLRNLAPRFCNLPYDRGNKFSIPYLWGTTGFAYNKTKVDVPLDSWGALFDERWVGRILMLDDMRECFTAALKFKGHSLNSTNLTELTEARDVLMKQKALVKTYNSSDFAGILRGGDVWLAHGYNGELAKACDEDKNLVYVVPKEGAAIWVDNLIIPKSSRHVEAAHRFINFMLEGRNMARVVNGVSYACANEAAKPFISPKILNDPNRYCDEATVARCEFMGDLADTTKIRDQYWTEIKAK